MSYTQRNVNETKLADAQAINNALQDGDTVIVWSLPQVCWGKVQNDTVVLGCNDHGNLQICSLPKSQLVGPDTMELRAFGNEGKRLIHAVRPSLSDAWAGRLVTEVSSAPCPQALQGEPITPQGAGKAYLTLEQKYWMWGVGKQKRVEQQAGCFWVRLARLYELRE